MNALVSISGSGQAVTSSNKVAEVFGKQHKDVLRAIGRIIEESKESRSAQTCAHLPEWFGESEYRDAQGKSRPCYIMTQQGFSLAVMGFTGPKALNFKVQFIQEFERMKAFIQNRQREEIQDLREKVERLQIQANMQLSAGYYQADLPEYSIIGFAASRGYKFNNATAIMYGRKATALSQKKGARIGKLKDPRFGFVNTYQTSILKEVFSQPIF